LFAKLAGRPSLSSEKTPCKVPSQLPYG
jgi:hypothetical protein